VDNVLGWLTFFIAAFVYCSTIEPTASFWDCPEFITTGYKLEVGHPPGAPFFMLTANLFSQFTSDPAQVARMVNMMSALLSAACILFLFWSITHLVRRLFESDGVKVNSEQFPLWKLIAIEASGLVGALIYTFSDTFWFSAVEGEVYAYSSAFTAVVFWLILKWEEHADEPHSDRWLVLIMYMTGLSIGVHLLNLLCLPAIVLVWYYKRFPNANAKGATLAVVISFVILAAVLYGVVPGIITVGGWFELFFVNDLHMPFNTGVLIYLVLLIGSVIWAIYETQHSTEKNWKRQNIAFLLGFGLLGIPFYGYGWSAFFIGVVVLAIVGWALFRRDSKSLVPFISARLKNTTLLCMLMLMIGYSTYAVIVIRSSANPPMDQNSPEDIFTLGNYLSRDQYGYRPLLYGQTFASEYQAGDNGYAKIIEKAPIYERKEKANPNDPDEYFIADHKMEVAYAQNMFFPRMYSSSPNHVEFYKTWHGGISGKEVPSEYSGQTITLPTFWDNLSFFFSYQCNYMYWRYFLWNFAGRQNDLQGSYGENDHGNAITGFSFIDNSFLGDQSLLPDELKQNKGHNVFYCMPLIIGLIGLFWQLMGCGRKGRQQFSVVFFLFFMTGLAIVLYLNQTPLQPRERDYAYAGSFYAYAIWCGMGVAAIIDLIRRKVKALNENRATIVAAVVALLCLIVPIQMASQTWDDHDRSDRYTCRDFGQNYLMSLQQEGNPIIYTNGDNDTFPLWYNQDTEGFRTDARVCNLSYLGTDWYIDQMVRPAYDSPSLPITWPRLKYVSGTNDAVPIAPSMKQEVLNYYEQYPDEARKNYGDDPFELKNIMKYWVLTDNDELHFIPTDTVYITIDKDAVRRSGMLIQNDTIPDRMAISLTGMRQLDKSKLMMLEMLANANWERPLYVAMTVGGENTMNLDNHFVQEGLCYRITPYNVNEPGFTNFDTERTYDNVMNRFKFGGVDKPGIYLDETVMRMCYTHRSLMVILAMQLKKEGDNLMEQDSIVTEAAQLKYDKAIKVLDKMEKELPSYNVPYDMYAFYAAGIYVDLGQPEKAKPIYDYLWKRADQYVEFYCSFTGRQFLSYEDQCRRQFSLMSSIAGDYEAIDSGKAMAMVTLLKKRFSEFSEKQALYESQLQGE
jgi:tetratricopeptide (TPR) repeat protein